jgi:integrase
MYNIILPQIKHYSIGKLILLLLCVCPYIWGFLFNHKPNIYSQGVMQMAYFRKVKANNKQGYKWVCVKDGPPDPVTGKRRQISRRADTKKEAEAKVDEVLKELTEHGIDESKVKHLTFEDVAWEWYNVYSRGNVKPNTIRVRKNEIKVLLRYIAKVNINKITHKMHQDILNDLDDKGYARVTIEGVHVTANMIYKYAIKNKMRKDNPASGAVIPNKPITVEEIEKNSIEEKYLEKSELEDFLKACWEYGTFQDVVVFYLLAFSGMRSGELLSLKWSDINFETNEIRITKTMYNPNCNMRKYLLTTPKTKGSIRTVDVDETVIELLKRHKENQEKENEKKLKDKDEEYHNGNFVFCHKNGYPYVQRNLIMWMGRLIKHTNITKKATPHIFRHTHISMLAEAGVDLPTIMKRVGHEDQETTLKIYTHVTEKMKKNANEKIKIYFKDILNIKNQQKM